MTSKRAGIGIVLLPGADGSAEFRADFLAELGAIQCQIIAYPSAPLRYDELVDWIGLRLPSDRPYVLFGESFGGPLALLLASNRASGLVGVVLCASFARYPSRALAALAPLLAWLPLGSISHAMAARWGLDRWRTPRLCEELHTALCSIPPAVLRSRLTAAAHIDVRVPLSLIDVPLLYIQASRDRLVPAVAARDVSVSVRRVTVERIDGPHFLLQAVPRECAEVTRRFLRGISIGIEGE